LPIGPPTIPVKLGDVVIPAVLDTGCVQTLITSRLMSATAEKGWEKKLLPTELKLNSATGHRLDVMGKIPRILTVGRAIFEVEVVVVREPKRSMFLLGNNTMYDRISIHAGKMVSVRSGVDHTRDLIPIIYNIPPQKVLQIGRASCRERV
jgi:hypothetical protein